MGSSSSKTQDNSDRSERAGEINNSSGFHLLELHLGTLKGVLALFLFALALAAGIYWCRRVYRRRQTRAHRYGRQQPWNPAVAQRPMYELAPYFRPPPPTAPRVVDLEDQRPGSAPPAGPVPDPGPIPAFGLPADHPARIFMRQ